MTYLEGTQAFGGMGSPNPLPQSATVLSEPFRTNIDAATSGGSGGANKLWLPVWSGEVMYAYDQYRVFEPLVESRTISSGRAMEFPIMGSVNLKPAWFAGEELLGQTNDHKSQTIAVTLDNRPIAAFFELDNVDLMITQWQYRQELARQAGQTLANARDLQIASYIIRAGAESVLAADPRLKSGSDWTKSLKDGPVYDSIFNANFGYLDHAGATDQQSTDGALGVLAAIEDFMIHLQEINADTNGVTCAVTPKTFHDIRALGVARDSGDLGGGAGRPFFGGVADAGGLGAGLTNAMAGLSDSLEYMSCRIVKTNHLPNWDASAGNVATSASTGIANGVIGEGRYNLDFTANKVATTTSGNSQTQGTVGIKGMIWQSKAVASLSLQGMKVDTVEDVRRNTNFTVASMMAGTGVLRPECAAVIVAGATGVINQFNSDDKITRTILRRVLGMTPEYVNTGKAATPYYSG